MNKFLKYLLYVVTTITVLIACLIVYLVWFQPAFYFPKPTGQYAIGCKEYHWIDINRSNPLSNDPHQPHAELMVKIWYPTPGTLPEKPTTPYAPYLVNYFKKNVPLVWLFGLSRPIYVCSQPDASISQDVSHYPVIIFSPGFSGTHDSNTAHCENLASHGYIVVGISHPYDSQVVQFPDGRIAGGMKLLLQREHGKNLTQRRKLSEQNLEVRMADVHFVLDQLEKLNTDKNSPFYQRLDQKHIGIFGQSLGGATAVQMCRRDARVKAGVDMDGSLFGPDAITVFHKPFMFILAGDTVKMLDGPMTEQNHKKFGITSPQEETMLKERYLLGFERLARATDHDTYIFIIKGAQHIDFTDTAILKTSSPFSRLLIKWGQSTDVETGSIDGLRVTSIVNDYLVNFFDKYLKNKPSELLDGTGTQYPEIETKQWK